MPNRLIKESIRTSRSVNGLSDFEFRFWVYLITYVDDFGRGSADPEILRGMVFTRRKGITDKIIADTLHNLACNGMIDLYEVDGESFFCFPNWDKHQQVRAKKSKFPAPDDTCNRMISNDIKCARNPIQSESNPESESESESNPNARNARAARFTPPTLDEVEAYRLERGSKVDPQGFIDFYASKGWLVGKTPMKDWKAAFRNAEHWERWEKTGGSSAPQKSFTEIANELAREMAEGKDVFG